MYKQSDAALAAWRATERTLDGKVTITDSSGNETDYGTSDITSIAYDSGAWTGDTFSIGSTYENNITVTFAHLVEGLKQGYKVTAKIGIKLPDGTYEYCPLGVFIISDEITMDRNNDATTIKAYDQFCAMQGTYTSKLTYPAKITDVIAEIANMSGVELNTDDIAELPTQTDLASAISGQTYCTAIGWIAQFYGGFALFDRDGKLTIRTVTDASYILDASQYEQSGLTKNEATYQIGGMSVSVTTATTDSTGESSETTSTLTAGETTGSQIELTNNVMAQSRLDSIWSTIKDITFYPYSLTWFGNPAIEAGDWLTLKDTAGNSFNVPNNSYTMTFDGGLTATSKADQTSTSSSSYSYSVTLSQTVKQLAGRQGATGNYIYGTDTTVEPTTAKIGDLWYKQNGNQVEMWQYVRQSDGTGKWELIVSDATGEEIKANVDKAMAEADTAKQNANNAVTTADNALSNAQTAISNAQTASDTANDATTVANNAISAATTASENASSALSSATSAVSTADTASDNANSAITKAESAISTANSSSDIANAVKQDVTSLKDGSTMTIAEIENGLALKLVKKDLDGYATEDWASTQISATASGLQTQITSVKSTATTNTTNINTLNSRADGFDIDIASVQTQVNNSAVGTNLLTGTSMLEDSNWIWDSSVVSFSNGTILYEAKNITSGSYSDVIHNLISVNKSTQYTLSWNLEYQGSPMYLYVVEYKDQNNTTASYQDHALSLSGSYNTSDRKSMTFTTQSDCGYLKLFARCFAGSEYSSININFKLEKGSVATDYSANPADNATQNWTTNQISVTSDSLTAQITSVKKTADTNKTNITTLSANVDGITTSVTSLQTDNNTNKTNISTLQQKATGFESNIATINTNVSSNTTNINNLQATSTSLSSTISSVQTQVNNSAVGTNLLLGTSSEVQYYTLKKDSETQGINETPNRDQLATQFLTVGETYTYRAKISNTGYTGTIQVAIWDSSSHLLKTFYGNNISKGEWGYSSVTFEVPENAYWFNFSAIRSSDTIPANTPDLFAWKEEKLELGSHATDWLANPADNATVTSVSNITQKVDSLSTIVSGKVDNTTYTSKITELANSIATKVESSDYNSKMTQLDNAISAKVSSSDYTSQVNILTNQINSKVSQTDFNSLGQVNLVPNGGFIQGIEGWGAIGSPNYLYYSDLTSDTLNGHHSIIMRVSGQTSQTWYGAASSRFAVKDNNTISYQAWIMVWELPDSNQTFSLQIEWFNDGVNGTNGRTDYTSPGTTTIYSTGSWVNVKAEGIQPPSGTNAARLVLYASMNGAASMTQVMATPGPTIGSYVENVANYSQIQQLSDNINLRVVKNDVINQINISTEGILIAGEKVHITGQTTIDNAVIKSAMIDSISADKITAGTLNAANVNVINLNANNISSGTLSADHIYGGTLNAANVSVINLNANNITTGTLSGDYISGGTITGVSFHQSSSDMQTWIDNNGIHNYDGSHSTWIKNGQITTNYLTVSNSSGDSSAVFSFDSTGLNIFTPYILLGEISQNFALLSSNMVNLGTSKSSLYLYDDKFSVSVNDDGIFYNASAGMTLASENGITLRANNTINVYPTSMMMVWGDFDVTGSKNAIVQTSAGWAKINAYETAEYYFGDIAKINTGSGSKVKIEMDSLFLETVNTNVDYHVFVSSYGAGYAWISEQTSTYFVVESSTPNLEVSYEIKAKRKGYENTRLEIDKDFGKEAA